MGIWLKTGAFSAFLQACLKKIVQNKGFWGPLGGLLWASGLFWAFSGLLGLFPGLGACSGLFLGFCTSSQLFLGLETFSEPFPSSSLFWAFCGLLGLLFWPLLDFFPTFSGGLFWWAFLGSRPLWAFWPLGAFSRLFCAFCGLLGLFLGFWISSQPLGLGASSQPFWVSGPLPRVF